MPQQYQQVSGGACALTMYMEETPGKVAAGASGVRLAFASESFKRGSSKKQRSVIRDARGGGKPYSGMANLSGSLESASYAPQLGYIARALFGAPTSTAETAGKTLTGAVTDKGNGLVGLPCAGHGFVQDAVVSVAGTANYDGTYRVAEGVGVDELVIEAPFKAETLAGAKLYRGRICALSGAAKDLTGGKVGLPVKGGVHALNAGEKITVSGTTGYDGTHVLQSGSENGVLVITATFSEETFAADAVAVPLFYRHAFTLPRRQPTLCMEKYLDFESGAATAAYSRFSFCKVNGLNFSFGGDDELKFSLEFVVGREIGASTPIDATPETPPAVPFDNIETAVWINGVRRGEVESGQLSNSFGIEAKAAVGDLGQYSRMPEGDPDSKCALTCFLESDVLTKLSAAASTVSFAVSVCAVTGEEVWFRYPETELDAEGAAITGKEGLMQTVTVMPFVDKGNTIMTMELINRVESYA